MEEGLDACANRALVYDTISLLGKVLIVR
jgi:hypothetical protein